MFDRLSAWLVSALFAFLGSCPKHVSCVLQTHWQTNIYQQVYMSTHWLQPPPILQHLQVNIINAHLHQPEHSSPTLQPQRHIFRHHMPNTLKTSWYASSHQSSTATPPGPQRQSHPTETHKSTWPSMRAIQVCFKWLFEQTIMRRICGQFTELKKMRTQNWNFGQFDPSKIRLRQWTLRSNTKSA